MSPAGIKRIILTYTVGIMCLSTGRLIAECPPGLTDCDGQCVDLMSNVAYCGACDVSCNPGEVCVEGICVPLAPEGACCLPEGGCVALSEQECTGMGGAYMGDDVPCEPNPCLSPNNLPIVSDVVLAGIGGADTTYEDLLVQYTVYDADADPCTVVINWHKDGIPIAVLNMPFEANGGNEATSTADYSGHGNDGTVVGAIWEPSAGHDGWGAYSLDGTGYIEVPDHSSLRVTQSFAIEAWIKQDEDSIGTDRTIVSKNEITGDDQPGYIFMVLKSNQLLFLWEDVAGANHTVTSNSNLTDTVWHHVVAVRDALKDRSYIYVDGILDNYVNDPAEMTTVVRAPLYIGAASDAEYPFKGIIGDVRIYRISLSEDQVLALYQQKDDLIVSQQTNENEIWEACVTPNDGIADGLEVCSNLLTIVPSCGYYLAGDLNNDCKVDMKDMAFLASHWLVDCNLEPGHPDCIPK